MAMSLQETGTRPRHRLVDRSNVASCAIMNDQISVSGKYLSSICVIVVHPLSILISEDIFAYNDLYFIVLSLFRFPLWVICELCRDRWFHRDIWISKSVFWCILCSRGGDLKLNLTIFRRPTHGCFTKISGHRHKSPPLPAPPSPPPSRALHWYVRYARSNIKRLTIELRCGLSDMTRKLLEDHC